MSRHPDSPRSTSHPFSTTVAWFFALLALALTIRLAWISYTQYTEEDAFITFRFAKQLAAGNGFVYNIGEKVYGTTTPLFTLLLAAWMKFVSNDMVLGARIFNLLASCGTLFFTWQTLRLLTKSTAVQLLPVVAIAFSFKLTYMETQGMEMPVVLCLMAASWYACAAGRIKLAGALAGLLLWTRMDLAFWPAALILATSISNLKGGLQLALAAALTYLPWLVFSTFYFDSLIPHTVTAKWVAYSQFNRSPYLTHFLLFLNYLTPFDLQQKFRFLGPLLVWIVVALAMLRSGIYRDKPMVALIVFIFIELIRITLTRATFFSRYFVPSLWGTLILFGIGLGVLWDGLNHSRASKILLAASISLIFLVGIRSGIRTAAEARDKQTYRFDGSLMAMGSWLNQNTAPQSSVLLEPLGYVGYYSERTMIDEVGLVTPAVTLLKLQSITSDQYPSIFHPDYVVLHCDDAVRLLKESDLGRDYLLTRTFDPLAFTQGNSDPNTLARSSCYQIWQSMSP